MHVARILLALTLTFAASGCRSRASVQDAYDAREGTSYVYDVDPVTAYEASLDVLENEGIDELEEHPRDLYALGGFGMNVVSWGTWVGVWIDPAPGGSEVTVVTKRKAVGNVATVLTETTFHERLWSRLERRRRAAAR